MKTLVLLLATALILTTVPLASADVPRCASPYSYNAVKAVQKALKQQGFNPGPADGDWGPKVHSAVAEFQLKHNLDADGELNETTLHALFGKKPPAISFATVCKPGERCCE